MKPKLTTGMLKVVMDKTGASRYLINAVIAGRKIDPELRDKISAIITEENNKTAELQQQIKSL